MKLISEKEIITRIIAINKHAKGKEALRISAQAQLEADREELKVIKQKLMAIIDEALT